MIMFLMTLVSGIGVTVGIALGGHVFAWEVLAWAWTAVVYSGLYAIERWGAE
jgi:hypothetical protein